MAEVSLLDFTFVAGKDTSIDEIVIALRSASDSFLNGILGITDEEVVSSDMIDDNRSSVYDSLLTMKNNLHNQKRHFRLFSLFDNEWGYANRVVDLLLKISEYY